MTVQMPEIDPALIPKAAGNRLFVETLNAMRRVQQQRPDIWARIESRAEELRAQKANQHEK